MKILKGVVFSRMAALAAGALLLTGSAVSVAADDSADWQYGLSIYGWFPGVSGELNSSIPGSGEGVSVDIDQIIDSLKMTFMGSFEVRKGAWAGFTDLLYLNLGDSASKSVTLPSGATRTLVDADMDLKSWVWTLGGAYTVLRSQGTHLDLIAGARLLALDMHATLKGPNQEHRLSESINLWDGIVGVKGRVAINERWFLPYYADVGTGDTKLTWLAAGGVGYAFDWGDVVLDYRHLEYEQSDDKALRDIAFNGGRLGVVFQF